MISFGKKYKEYLDSLKPGDEVVIALGNYEQTPAIARVVRRTKTQVIVKRYGTDFEMRFRKKDGRMVGSESYYSSFIRHCSPEELKEIKNEKQFQKLVRELEKYLTLGYTKERMKTLERMKVLAASELTEAKNRETGRI